MVFINLIFIRDACGVCDLISVELIQSVIRPRVRYFGRTDKDIPDFSSELRSDVVILYR